MGTPVSRHFFSAGGGGAGSVADGWRAKETWACRRGVVASSYPRQSVASEIAHFNFGESKRQGVRSNIQC